MENEAHDFQTVSKFLCLWGQKKKNGKESQTIQVR